MAEREGSPAETAAGLPLYRPDAPPNTQMLAILTRPSRYDWLHPAPLSLLFTVTSLFWLLAVSPWLNAWLYPKTTTTALHFFARWPDALAMIMSGIVLYALLRVHANTILRLRTAQDLRLAELLEQLPDAAFIKDLQGDYCFLNAAAVRLVGRPLNECLNRNDLALFSPEIAQALMAQDQAVIMGRRLLHCIKSFTFQGSVRTFHCTQWPYWNAEGSIVGIIGFLRDTTAQKYIAGEDHANAARSDLEARVRERTAQLSSINTHLERQIAARIQAEVALRESEERFRQLTEHIREVFWVYDILEERLLYISPAYEEIWGRPIQGLYERPLDWIEAVHFEDQPRVHSAHVAKRQSGYFEEEYRIVRPDHTTRWIWDRGFPIHDEAGHAYRIAGLAEDITRRKLAEDQLRRQQVELARMSRLSLAVELAANLAHELNQPLAAIVAYTQACLALLRQADTDPRVLTGPLDAVISQGLRAGEIIRHLRELVQKHPATHTKLDLNALIHSVVHYAQTEFQQAHILLKLELAAILPPVLADDLQIQLVVLYLIRNAIDALNEKDREPRELTLITALLNPDQVLTTIHDTGQGFSAETAAQLFQPFFTTKPTGMGLGLSVSRSIIEAQGGKLWATLNPEGGASFHFTLPVSAPP